MAVDLAEAILDSIREFDYRLYWVVKDVYHAYGVHPILALIIPFVIVLAVTNFIVYEALRYKYGEESTRRLAAIISIATGALCALNYQFLKIFWFFFAIPLGILKAIAPLWPIIAIILLYFVIKKELLYH